MMDTELAACKLCDCDMWREPESLMDNDEGGGRANGTRTEIILGNAKH